MMNYTKEEKEAMVSELVSRVYGNTVPEKIDMEKVASSGLGLHVVYEEFAEEENDRMAFLADGQTPLTVNRMGLAARITFPAGTLVVDSYLKNRRPSECDFAIAHECGHFMLSGRDFSRLHGCFKTYFDSSRTYTAEEIKSRLGFEEAEADGMAYMLLMPDTLLTNLLYRYNGGNKLIVYDDAAVHPETVLTVERMASEIGRKYMQVFHRLRQRGLIDKRPLAEYVSVFCARDEEDVPA